MVNRKLLKEQKWFYRLTKLKVFSDHVVIVIWIIVQDRVGRLAKRLAEIVCDSERQFECLKAIAGSHVLHYSSATAILKIGEVALGVAQDHFGLGGC